MLQTRVILISEFRDGFTPVAHSPYATSIPGRITVLDFNIPRPRGVYCLHDKRIMVPEDEGVEYSDIIFADPYPCDAPGCSIEVVTRKMNEEAVEYEEERWAEYNADIYLSLCAEPYGLMPFERRG